MKALIGITTHNRVTILPKAIQSALDQNYANKEVAVFDDASTDGTAELRSRFSNVHWLRVEKSEGYLAARNRMMRETDADLYFSLDDDAWFVNGDEISIGVKLMQARSNIAAIAYEILSPDKPGHQHRKEPYRTHSFIGCGHMLRLSAVKEANFYTPNPGFYGAEEKDLSLQLMNRGYEIFFLPGVHVWHDKTMEARDLFAQHVSGVCNDMVVAYRRCPLPMALWLIPGKVFNHLRFSFSNGLGRSCFKGLFMFTKSLPSVLTSRAPVSASSFQKYIKLSRDLS